MIAWEAIELSRFSNAPGWGDWVRTNVCQLQRLETLPLVDSPIMWSSCMDSNHDFTLIRGALWPLSYRRMLHRMFIFSVHYNIQSYFVIFQSFLDFLYSSLTFRFARNFQGFLWSFIVQFSRFRCFPLYSRRTCLLYHGFSLLSRGFLLFFCVFRDFYLSFATALLYYHIISPKFFIFVLYIL